jgi:hypothetical protein
MKFIEIEVRAYSGYRINERPLSFRLRGQVHEVAEIVDRWHEGRPEPGSPYLNYFKVRTAGGKEYLLRYNGLFDAWSVMVSD